MGMPPYGYPPPPMFARPPPPSVAPPVAPPPVAPSEPQAPPEETQPMEESYEDEVSHSFTIANDKDPSVLVPTALRIKRKSGTQPKPKVHFLLHRNAKAPPTKKTQQKNFETTDQAFDIFMKDMKNLGAL